MPAVACAQVLRYVLLRHSRVAARCSTVRSNVPWDMKGWRAPTRVSFQAVRSVTMHLSAKRNVYLCSSFPLVDISVQQLFYLYFLL